MRRGVVRCFAWEGRVVRLDESAHHHAEVAPKPKTVTLDLSISITASSVWLKISVEDPRPFDIS